MSSILKALKKLESEKSQRDELSTAVASDILRASRKSSRKPAILIISICVLVFAVAAAGYYTAILLNTSAGRLDQPESYRTTGQSTVGAEKPTSAVSTPPSGPAPVDLPRLSGIVYQDNPDSRLAIINDLPVMEGTLVEGYQVQMIYPDRVLLLKDSTEHTLLLEQE